MTTATHDEYPGLEAIAGGRGNWSYNPDRCVFESVVVEGALLAIKVSAGGYDRGISILLKMPLDFLEQMRSELIDNQEFLDSHLIEFMGLEKRTNQVLRQNSITTIGALRLLSRKQLLSMGGFGRVSLKAVEDWLGDRGLALRRDR